MLCSSVDKEVNRSPLHSKSYPGHGEVVRTPTPLITQSSQLQDLHLIRLVAFFTGLLWAFPDPMSYLFAVSTLVLLQLLLPVPGCPLTSSW